MCEREGGRDRDRGKKRERMESEGGRYTKIIYRVRNM